MKRLLGLEEAAEYLDVCVNTFEKWVEEGLIKRYRKDGLRRVFYDVHDLDQFFENEFDRVEKQRSMFELIERRRK